MKPNYSPALRWVEERENIRIRKEAGKKLLTKDSILATYRFCNVRREDDTVTIWVKENIRKPFRNHKNLWLMLCIARQINWPPALEALIHTKSAWPSASSFNPQEMAKVLDRLTKRGEKVFTGAYIVTAGPTKGVSKAQHIADVTIGKLWKDRNRFYDHFDEERTLQSTHSLLYEYNGWGPFLAYQAVVDMRFTSLLNQAHDRYSWAAAGPGTLRGLNRLHGRELEKKISQQQALKEMIPLYKAVKTNTQVKIDFSDVPNILCETDKYLRVKNKEGKPRSLYIPGVGSPWVNGS